MGAQEYLMGSSWRFNYGFEEIFRGVPKKTFQGYLGF